MKTPDDSSKAWAPVPTDDSPTLFPLRRVEFLQSADVPLERLREWRLAGWLSFDPEEEGRLEEYHLFEVRIVKSILESPLKAGAAEALLRLLPKPYRYDSNRLCYNFHSRSWQMLPARTPDEFEAQVREEFESDIDAELEAQMGQLAEEGDVDGLVEWMGKVTRAIKKAREIESEEHA